jgi:hypothetical protein
MATINRQQAMMPPQSSGQTINLRRKTSSKSDACTISTEERQSQDVYNFRTNNFQRTCQEPIYDDQLLNTPLTFSKAWGNVYMCGVDYDSDLRYSTLTNQHDLQQLFTAPYKTAPYRGAGTNNAHLKDLESSLLQQQYQPHFKSMENSRAHNIDRFDYLPSYGNPQVISKIVPVWTRGGVLSRDLVRRLTLGEYSNMIKQAPY